MTDSNLTVQNIVARCGGVRSIAERSTVSAWAIYKWYRKGIPEEHWDLVMSLAGVSVQQIYQANKTARYRLGAEVAA